MDTIITIISTIATTTGLLFGVFKYYMARLERKRKSWNQILKEVKKLSEKLNGKFDTIISFADGGLIAADLLHIKHHSDKPVISLNLEIERPDRGAKVVTVLSDSNSLNFLKSKRVLLIDDVVQTGRNMESAVNYLTSDVGIKRENIVTAVFGKPRGIKGFKVDYCGFRYNNHIELPWGPVPRHPYE